ncbi:MAG: 4-hydroxy-tetrahydrodipicolinate reductase [Wenzhouxiangellaceae bacterium]|nr:4-hydroxy-tetrahydrodipicolinate reductase [Wenzhouxiangellaceae bacterium]
MSIRVLLSGATGKVGGEIRRLVGGSDSFCIVGEAGQDAFFESAEADVVIDFSRPHLTERCAAFCAEHGLPLVTGTTGLSQSQREAISEAAREVPVCQAANFSVGAHVMLRLAAEAARMLDDSFDCEILETHHRHKVDAPSGTALALADAVAAAPGSCASGHRVTARSGETGPRVAGSIGIQALRGGDVAGEHTAMFLGPGERIELVHRATDRAIFARGALRAARWLVERPSGLYGMDDVLDAG